MQCLNPERHLFSPNRDEPGPEQFGGSRQQDCWQLLDRDCPARDVVEVLHQLLHVGSRNYRWGGGKRRSEARVALHLLDAAIQRNRLSAAGILPWSGVNPMDDVFTALPHQIVEWLVLLFLCLIVLKYLRYRRAKRRANSTSSQKK